MINDKNCKHYERDVRGWIATDDIVHHVETCRSCGKEVYHVWNYNDGGSTPGRDAFKRIICDYRPIAGRPCEVSEREAVNEAISNEPLTVAEMLGRMPKGWTLVSDEHFDKVVKIKNENHEKVMKLEKRMSNWRLTLLTAAMDLGGGAGQTHRDKDEIVLKSIQRILRVASECDPENEPDTLDDIPF